MKRFLLLCSLFSLASTSALDTSCFRLQSQSTPASVDESFRVDSRESIYPLQDGNIIPIRQVINTTPTDYINSTVITSTGFQNAQFEYLGDNNPETFLQFVSNPKSITLRLDTPLIAGEFSVMIDADTYDLGEVEISSDGQKYTPIMLSDIEEFSFRFVRFSFVDIHRNSSQKLFTPTKIRDILFSKKAAQSYLTKSLSGSPITIYSGVDCDQKDLQTALSGAYNAGARALMSTDINTRIISLDRTNISYQKDKDSDGINNSSDNCPLLPNKDQKDTDHDLIGDLCDIDPVNRNPLLGDSDDDGLSDARDNCLSTRNPDQRDSNADGKGDACSDDDRDGIIGYRDNCPTVSNSDQKDINANRIGDVCESDRDGDGYFDSVDVCPGISNPTQEDSDSDGIGDLCDNCNRYNPDQRDADNDSRGDACSEWDAYQKTHDDDSDSVLNWEDNCVKIPNPRVNYRNPLNLIESVAQPDQDADGIGDVCDNCLSIQNTDQKDINHNSTGDMCEDIDGDGRQSYDDNCPLDANAEQSDKNNDGIGDVCDDSDTDSLRASVDNCRFVYNPEQLDSDSDGIGDLCDTQDGRYIESNKTLFITLFSFIGLALLGGIIWLTKKMIK